MLFDFNQVAHEYDQYYETSYGKNVDAIEKKALDRFLPLLEKSDKNLEIGCGTGHWTSYFTEKGFQITAIDLSTEMLQHARRKQIKNARFLRMDAHHLEFAEESFQNIFSIATLEFVQDQEQVWTEINRVLYSGGHFIIGALNQNSQIGKTKDQDPVFRNGSFFTAESLQERLSTIGDTQIIGTLLMDEQFQILDESNYEPEYLRENGCFLVGLVKKR